MIFGAAIRPDGQPSGTLRRRVEGAYRIGSIFRDPIYLVTGGVGRYGPAEATVMRDQLLGYGVPARRMRMTVHVEVGLGAGNASSCRPSGLRASGWDVTPRVAPDAQRSRSVTTNVAR